MSSLESSAEHEEPLPGVAGDGDSATALAGLMRRLSAAQTREQILTTVSHGIRTLLGADGATFVLRDGDQCYYAEEDAISPLWKGRRFPMVACISGWCMLHRRHAAIPDIYKDSRVPTDAYRPTFVRSLIMVPVGQEPIAAIGAYWAAHRQPRTAELVRLQTIADAAALALSNVLAREQVRTVPPSATAFSVLARARRAAASAREGIRRIGLRPGTLSAYVFALACVTAATLVREVIRATGVEGLAVFATFYPAVLIAVLFGGRGPGILAATLGGLSAYYFFLSPLDAFQSLTPSDLLNLALYGGAAALIILVIDRYKQDLTRLRREDALHLTLAREQHHRTRNAAAVVEAIVQQSLRDLPDRAGAINRRVRAGLDPFVAAADETAEPFRVHDLLSAELGAYDLSRFRLAGPDDALPSGGRNVMALVIHEMATNALKHGALSVSEGSVEVTWRIEGGRAVIRWREAGGPIVEAPQRRGYGSTLLSRLVQGAGGTLVIEYPASGLVAELSLALTPRGGPAAAA